MTTRSLGRRQSTAAAIAFGALFVFASPAGAVFGQKQVIGSPGTGDGQFTKVVGIATAPANAGAPNGQLFVADKGVNGSFTDTFRIQEFSHNGVFRRSIAVEVGNPSTGLLPDAFSGMVADPARDALYVAKGASVGSSVDHIEKYLLSTGVKQADLDTDTGALESPGPIAVDTTLGDVFVAGTTSGGDPKIQKYNSAGQLKGSRFGSSAPDGGPTTPGDFNVNGIDGLAVRHVSASGGAKVFVMDLWQDDPEAADPADDAERVQRFTVTGDVTNPKNDWSYDAGSEFKSNPATEDDVAFQSGGLAAEPTAGGHLFLTQDANEDDPTAAGVIEVTESGTEVRRWGSKGTGVCQFALQSDPPYIDLDSSGNVYAVDVNNVGSTVQRVLKFGEGGSGCGFDNQLPNATFTFAPPFPKKNQNVQFDAGASIDPDGSIDKYEWDLDGNGSFETDTGTDPHAAKTYTQTGAVDVKLRVTDNQTAQGTFTQIVNVTGTPPVASFNFSPAAPQTGTTVTFNGTASTDEGSIAKYDWDLDGDGTIETFDAGPQPTKAYATAGTRTIKLRVTDDDGLTDSTTRQLTVAQAPTPPGGGGGAPGGGGIGGVGGGPPSNAFSFAAVSSNGTPTLTVTLPSAGSLDVSGTANVSRASKIVPAGTAHLSAPKAGSYKIVLKLTGAAKKALKKKKKLKLNLLVKFTPSGGTLGQRTSALTLKAKKKKKK